MVGREKKPCPPVPGDDGLDLLDQLLLPGGGAPAPLDGARRDAPPLVDAQAEGLLHGAVVLEDVAAKVGRVVAVDAEAHAAVEEGPDGHLAHLAHAPQHDVGHGAQAQQRLARGQPRQQRVVLGRAPPVVDALDVEVVERRDDEGGGPLLADVRRAPDAGVPGGVVDGAEHGGRVGRLAARHAEAGDGAVPEVAGVAGLEEHAHGVVDGAVAQQADDVLDRHAEVGLGAAAGAAQAVDDGAVGDAAGRVGLGVEEDLGVADVLGVRLGEVGVPQLLEVGGGQQHGEADEVVVQEVVERGEVAVALVQRLDAGEGWIPVGGQGDAVLRGEAEQQLGREGALDVDVIGCEYARWSVTTM
ncbi:hypothetical protein ColKHC_13345 [Colletotrichum higginsianum]|nr:hypothetical protein ColKHC_13345 [Colletotrichum higginsianum]